ncbi:MAG: hypothetical protein AAF533_11430 [Acidobacteriota bacterium]
MNSLLRSRVLSKTLGGVILLVASGSEVGAKSFEEKDWRRFQMADATFEAPIALEVKTDSFTPEQRDHLLAHEHLIGGDDDFLVSAMRLQHYSWNVLESVDEAARSLSRNAGASNYDMGTVDARGAEARFVSYRLGRAPKILVETMLVHQNQTKWMIQVYYQDASLAPSSKRVLESLLIGSPETAAGESPPVMNRASTQPAWRSSTQPVQGGSTGSGWSPRRHGSLHFESPFPMNEDLDVAGQRDETLRTQVESMTMRGGTMREDLAAVVREIVHLRGASHSNSRAP